MRSQVVGFVLAALTAMTASGRPSAEQSTVLHVANGEQPRNLQEIASIVRVIAGATQVFIDAAKSTVAVGGTSDQIALANWLVSELNQPAADRTAGNSAAHEYRIASTGDDVVRIFYLSQPTTQQGLQEITTVIRTVADVILVFPYSSQAALAVRGTAPQIAASAWLIDAMDQPAASGRTSVSSEPHEYRMPGNADDVIRVFYLAQSETPQNLQKVAGTIRSTTKARRLFTKTDQKAVIMRGTNDQIAAAEQVISERQ